MLVGASRGYMEWPDLVARCGGTLDIRRGYYQPNEQIPASFDADYADDENAHWLSFKADVPMRPDFAERLRAYIRTIPPDRLVYITIRHEPEELASRPTDFQAIQQVARQVIDEENFARQVPIQLWGVWMAQSGRDGVAAAMMGDLDAFDGVGWDGYRWDANGKSWPQVYDPCVQYCLDRELVWGIAEVGTPYPAPDRLDQMQALLDYAEVNDAMAVCWWNNQFAGKPNFKLIEDPEFELWGSAAGHEPPPPPPDPCSAIQSALDAAQLAIDEALALGAQTSRPGKHLRAVLDRLRKG